MSAPLKDYELEIVAKIREASPQLRGVSDNVLCAAWGDWSEIHYCAGFLCHSPNHMREFLEWAETPPVESLDL